LTEVAEALPLRLKPKARQVINLPLADSQPAGNEAKAAGRFINGTNQGAMLTDPIAGYENIEHGTTHVHWSDPGYKPITFAQWVRTWVLISDTDVFDDNWKLYYPDHSIFYALNLGQFWEFDARIKGTLLKRNGDNHTTKFDWYGIY